MITLEINVVHVRVVSALKAVGDKSSIKLKLGTLVFPLTKQAYRF